MPPSVEQFEAEFFPNWVESALPKPDLQWCDLTPDEWREVIRDRRGTPLCQEDYQLDVDALQRGDQKPTSSALLVTNTALRYTDHSPTLQNPKIFRVNL